MFTSFYGAGDAFIDGQKFQHKFPNAVDHNFGFMNYYDHHNSFEKKKKEVLWLKSLR